MSVLLTAYPFGEVDSTEAQFASLFAALQDDGLSGVPGSSNAQVTPGSGMTVSVAAFPFAYLSGGVATLAAPTTLTVAAPSTQARIDRVVVRMNWATDIAELDILKGAAGSGTAPALTQVRGGVYEISLARIAVAPGALNLVSGNITDERAFVSDRVHRWSTATRPAAAVGLLGFNFTTKKFEYSIDGTTWIALAAEQPKQVATGTVFAGWNLSRFKLTKRGARVYIDFSAFRTGAQINGNANGNIVNVKVGNVGDWVPSSEWAGLSSGPGGPTCSVAVAKNGDMLLCAMPPNFNFVSGTELTAGGSWDTDVA